MAEQTNKYRKHVFYKKMNLFPRQEKHYNNQTIEKVRHQNIKTF